jgi:hypothetical protein
VAIGPELERVGVTVTEKGSLTKIAEIQIEGQLSKTLPGAFLVSL